MITTLYDKLRARNYREYTVCQLPGCSNELKKLSGKNVKKYCCQEHAKKAQRLYINEWRMRNRDRVKKWNKRYVINRKKRIKEGSIIIKKHEYKKNKTD